MCVGENSESDKCGPKMQRAINAWKNRPSRKSKN
jgi:hypothetical protein